MSQNFSLDADKLFDLAVQAMETQGDWRMKKVDEKKHYAVASTPFRLSTFGCVVRVRVDLAKGKHTRELSRLVVTSSPRMGKALDWGGINAFNANVVMNQVVTFFNGLTEQ